MALRFNTSLDDPASRDLRRAVLARAPIFAGIPPDRLAPLLRRSAVLACPARSVLFRPGEPAGPVFLIGSGAVQLRIGLDLAGEVGARLPPLHLQMLGEGELVGDLELIRLAAGTASTARRETAAVVFGEAMLVALDQDPLAELLAEFPEARQHLAAAIVERLRRTQRLVNEALSFKQRGKVRVARLLIELFDAAGRVRGGAFELSQKLSHEQIAAFLGLTRRTVFDDIKALEDFDAIDHDRSGRLVLLDRARLDRIASFDPTEDKDDNAEGWLTDVDAALEIGDSVRARELAREALSYHPRHERLRHRAVLAALRSGAGEEADALIARFQFTLDHAMEDVAALLPRALKGRAAAQPDAAAARHFAQRSAQGYLAIYRRTGGFYSGINAASMFCLCGDLAQARKLAADLLARLPARVEGYWPHATRAEAFCLLADAAQATISLRAAMRQPDADPGRIASTCRQFRRLSASVALDWPSVFAGFLRRPVLVLSGPHSPDPGQITAAIRERAPSAVFLALATPEDLTLLAAIRPLCDAIALVLPAPVETLLRDPAFVARRRVEELKRVLAAMPCHLADAGDGPVTPTRARQARRHALGLGTMIAWLREADVLLPGPDHPDWTKGGALSEGFAALLWVEPATDEPAPTLADPPGATGRAAVEGGLVFRFGAVAQATSAALAAAVTPAYVQAGARLLLDIERIAPDSLAQARIARVRPATPACEVFATEEFAAELALIAPAVAKLRPVGRVRSSKRLNRLAVWAVTPPDHDGAFPE